MFKAQSAFAGVSVNDLAAAKDFYAKTLGLELTDESMGLNFSLPGGGGLFIYQKDDHVPATFTVLNFVVDDIDAAVDSLSGGGVKFEYYDDMPAKPDEKGIIRGLAANQGPDIAWFKDPAGNILSILQAK
jgi:catechol 2,3-dioxygenase-like lactoylglutathione lyase family enzyme